MPTAGGGEDIKHVVIVEARRKLLHERCEARVMHLTWDALASCVRVLNARGGNRRSWRLFDFALLRKMEVGKRKYKRVLVRRKTDARKILMMERHYKKASHKVAENFLSHGRDRFQSE